MGRLAKKLKNDVEALERGEAFVTESPIGDRGQPRPPVGQPNGRILLRISHREHATLVTEAAAQGVSLNHYLTEIVCARHRLNTTMQQKAARRTRSSGRMSSRKRALR
jgi:hypothetical protein